MSKVRCIAAIAAMLTAALATGSVEANASDCHVETAWRYCGLHVDQADLPLRFTVGTSGGPGGVDLARAAQDAMRAWNLAWPDATDAPLAYAGVGAAGIVRDGRNTISFGEPSACGAKPGAQAVACIWADGKKIKEVDIVLDRKSSWRDAAVADLVGGESAALHPYLAGMSGGNPLCPAPWFDVTSALAHELGHALGLEHIGGTQPFPATAADAPRFTQTMYAWNYPCSTNKRTPDAGDVAGLWRAAYESYA